MKILTLADFSHRLRVRYHARANDSGPNDAGERTLADLSEWRRNSGHLIVVCDAPPYLRAQEYPAYKAGRERDEAYIQICKWSKARLVTDGYSVASSPGHEADDCIASLARALEHRFDEVRIVSEDKDMLSCLTTKVKMYAPGAAGDFEVRDIEWLHNKWGIGPENVALFLAITGDSSDSIPGIKGIGPKGAASLITKYGTIEKMRIAAVAALEESTAPGGKPLPASWKSFLAGSPELPKWLALTTLRTDVPLDVDALLVRQPIRDLVTTPENIEHGDAWEPSEEEMKEEREMLAPEDVISGPKAAAVAGATTVIQSSVASQFQAGGGAGGSANGMFHEAKTELPKSVTQSPAPEPPSERSTSVPVGQSQTRTSRTASTEQPRASAETVSFVVDRPAPPSWALALQPASVREADMLATKLFNSRHYLKLEHAPGVLSIILKGRELGLGAMAALEMFYLVQNRPFPSAKGKHFLATRDPNCEWFIVTSADDKHATVKSKHREIGVLEYTYTIERAQRAGYLTGGNKHNWLTMPQEMLEARAKSKAADRWYPGSTFGMPTVEEMQDREGLEGSDDE